MKNKKSFLIFLICYFAYTSIYVARLNLSIASPEFLAEGLLNEAQIGLLGAAFSVIYACGRLLNGIIGDKTAPWIMISTGLVLTGISNLLFGLLPPFLGMFLLWGINAYAQSMLWSSMLCIISQTYGPEQAKQKTSFLVTSVATGNILGILFNTVLVTNLGVQFAFVIPGGITLIACVLVMLSTRHIRPLADTASKKSSFFSLLKQKEIIVLLFPAFFHGIVKENISLWMAVYFVDRFQIDLAASALFVLFIPAIGFVGRMIYPFVFRLCREKEHLVSIISFLICCVAVLPLCLDTVTPVIAAICLSLLYAAVSMINTSMLSIYPIRYAAMGKVASVSGIMDFATYLGGGLGSLVYGAIIGSLGYGGMYYSWLVVSAVSAVIIFCLLKKKTETVNESF